MNSIKILLVDDDRDQIEIYEAILEKEGFSVICALSSREALQVIEQQGEIALIVCDIKMPNIDGIQFVEHLNTISCPTPVILMTAGGEELRIDAEEVGVKGFIVKDSHAPQHLLKEIKNLLG